jgi:hypothetical protein
MSRFDILKDNPGAVLAIVACVFVVVVAIGVTAAAVTKSNFVVPENSYAIVEIDQGLFSKKERTLIEGPKRITIDEDASYHLATVVPAQNWEVFFSIRVVKGLRQNFVDKMPERLKSSKAGALMDRMVNVRPKLYEGSLVFPHLGKATVKKLFNRTKGSHVEEPLLDTLQEGLKQHFDIGSAAELQTSLEQTLGELFQKDLGLVLGSVVLTNLQEIDTVSDEFEGKVQSTAVSNSGLAKKGFDFYWSEFLIMLPFAILAVIASIGFLFACPGLAIAVGALGAFS